MYKRLLSLLILSCTVLNAQLLNNSQQVLNKTDKNYFIQNKGQWPAEVKYLARTGGMNAWITSSGVVYDYYKINKKYDEAKTVKMKPDEKKEYENKNTSLQGHVVKLQLVNEEKNVIQAGNNQRAGYVNYFTGNDKSKWASNVPLYDNVELQGVYKNIDVKYYYDNGMLRYDYKAKPGADISQLKFKFEGQEGIRINEKGELILKTSLGEVTNGKIYAYQSEGGTKKEVVCKFEQRQDGTVGLKAGNYDAKKELIIDPLVYSTFIGVSGDNEGNSIAVDASGNAYITGITNATNYPIITGAYQTANGGSYDAFVTKLNSSGSALVYSTFIGGSSGDNAYSIAIDAGGNAYITGATTSNNYPTTGGAYQTALNGSQNAFITGLNSTGSALIYSTYIGGSSYDKGNKILVDASGDAYISGTTSSSNFPTTGGAYQTSYGGGSYDVFVTKLNSSGSALVYSTFIGGNNDDEGNSIAIDASGNAYVTGKTASANFPVTGGVYQTIYGGGTYDAFVTKLKPDGSGLVYSTFIGGNVMEEGNSITIDAGGNSYITGTTSSSNYPATGGAYQTAKAGALDAFVTKLNPGGTALVYSTFIGGSGTDNGKSIDVDADGNAYITGFAMSSDYPVTSGAYQTAFGGGTFDTFVTKLNSSGSALVYSTYIGSDGDELGNSIAIDAGRNAYLTGYSSNSTTYPTTSGAYQTNFGGTVDVFVTKLDLTTLSAPDAVNPLSPVSGSTGLARPIRIKWSSAATVTSYRLQISTDSTFASGTINFTGLTDTTCNNSSLNNQTTYYWRVNAKNAAGSSPWSTVWNFTTANSVSLLTLVYPPANSTNITLPFKFTWKYFNDLVSSITKNDNVKNAKTITSQIRYWFELTADTTSAGFVVNDSTVVDTTLQVTGLHNSATYFWRIKVKTGSGWSDFTSWSKFTTVTIVPDAPVLLFPNSSSNIIANGSRVSFSWKGTSFASTYELQIATDNNCNTVLTDTTGITDTVFTGNLYYCYNYSTFYWRVRGINESGAGQWSAPMSVSIITGINDSKNNIPAAYQLYQNYPNPFNPSTLIKYALPFNSVVKIEIYNTLGAKVKELLNAQKTAGYYSVNFNTTGLASGVYLYVLKAQSVDGKSEYRETKKMMLLK